MKKIGILGSGPVGQALAKGFLKHGYPVWIGTNDPSKHTVLQQKVGAEINIATFKEVAKEAEILVLAVKGTAALSALQLADEKNLTDKTIIDTTNPIAEGAPANGVLHYFTSLEDSLMERLQLNFPSAHFVKAFNSVGNALMVNPDFGGIKPSMFICGNNNAAKKEVKDILDRFGWEVEDLGKAEAARAIEPLCILWCIPGFLSNQWSHAFKLLKK